MSMLGLIPCSCVVSPRSSANASRFPRWAYAYRMEGQARRGMSRWAALQGHRQFHGGSVMRWIGKRIAAPIRIRHRRGTPAEFKGRLPGRSILSTVCMCTRNSVDVQLCSSVAL